MQSKKHSLLEAALSTFIGFFVAYWAGWFILPAFGFAVTHQSNFIITCLFTVISVIRGYLVRRLFNLLHTRGML